MGVSLTAVHKHTRMHTDNVRCLFRALLHFGGSCTSVSTLSTKMVTSHELRSFVFDSFSYVSIYEHPWIFLNCVHGFFVL